MLSALSMTKNFPIKIYYLRYMVIIQNGRQWTKVAAKQIPTTFFLINRTHFIKKNGIGKNLPEFSHIDTTAYTINASLK